MELGRPVRVVLLALFCAQAAPAYPAEILTADSEFDQLLSMDIGDLTVTSVSKRPEKLSTTATAV